MKKILFLAVSSICLNVISSEAVIKQEILNQEKNIYNSQRKQTDSKVELVVGKKSEKTAVEKNNIRN